MIWASSSFLNTRTIGRLLQYAFLPQQQRQTGLFRLFFSQCANYKSDQRQKWSERSSLKLDYKGWGITELETHMCNWWLCWKTTCNLIGGEVKTMRILYELSVLRSTYLVLSSDAGLKVFYQQWNLVYLSVANIFSWTHRHLEYFLGCRISFLIIHHDSVWSFSPVFF